MNEPKESETKIIEVERTQFRIPECCQKGYESCPHIAKKQKKIKQNVGL